ncbi:polyprenol phosphomannose-dependent alpha 1,6 mannosyltransferase MptB [Micromonospora zingiberis]|uniref:polyprenol phosphomannose-dependent alpha 1,6 mannosyltransferase MptB n=1 Tax=Micromonospora zingiberis TaxID=2053011 RepID=UPI001F0E7110|nr:polyprenol phosphomannose-dependent alpha 1,6 mannosyltransferase MptB [Micromonospora zingiberis]
MTTRDRIVRWIGLAGALLLAIAGFLGGALPDETTIRVWDSDDGPLTVVLWLAGTAAMVGAWWALRDGAPSARWAYRTAGLWALPLLSTAPLGSRDVYSYACQGWVYADGADPYAIGVAAAGCPWLDAVAPVWRDTPAPYGPFFVLLAALAVLLGGGLVGTVALLRLLAVAGLLVAALCLPGLARAAGVPARRATWLLLASPLVGVHLVAGAHNDAVMLGLLLPGLLLLVRRPDRPATTPGQLPSGRTAAPRWLRSGRTAPSGLPSGRTASGQLPSGRFAALAAARLLVAGALLGLAVSVKATAVVVLPFAALLAVRGRPTLPSLSRDGGLLAVGVVGALVLTSLLSGLGLGWIGGLGSSGDTVQWTSPPTAVGMVVDYAGELAGRHLGAVPVARVVGLVLLAGFLVLLWWRTWSALRTVDPAESMSVTDPTRTLDSAEPSRALDSAEPSRALDSAEPRHALHSVEPTGTPGGVGWPSGPPAAERRSRPTLLGAGVALAATVILAPVFHPWYVTWPLAVLAVAATRTCWFVLPSALAAFLTLPDGTNLARLVKAPGAVAMTLLLVGLVIWALPRLHRIRFD